MSENFDTMNQKLFRQNYFDTIVDEDIKTIQLLLTRTTLAANVAGKSI